MRDKFLLFRAIMIIKRLTISTSLSLTPTRAILVFCFNISILFECLGEFANLGNLIGFFLCSQKIVLFSWSSTWFKKYFLAIDYFYAFITGRWVVFYLFICFSWLVGVHWSVLVSFFCFVCLLGAFILGASAWTHYRERCSSNKHFPKVEPCGAYLGITPL